jgi:hypothetical protein
MQQQVRNFGLVVAENADRPSDLLHDRDGAFLPIDGVLPTEGIVISIYDERRLPIRVMTPPPRSSSQTREPLLPLREMGYECYSVCCPAATTFPRFYVVLFALVFRLLTGPT